MRPLFGVIYRLLRLQRHMPGQRQHLTCQIAIPIVPVSWPHVRGSGCKRVVSEDGFGGLLQFG